MRIVISLGLLLALSVYVVHGQQSTKAPDTLTYAGTRLTYPLVEGWIKEYKKANPGTVIKLHSKNDSQKSADLNFLAYDLSNEKLKDGEQYVVVSNYAQLPISNSANPLLTGWNKSGLTKQEFKKLYFKTADQPEEKPAHNTVTIYKRDRPVCATKTFASHYGSDPNDGKGLGVQGDDRTLLEAVLKDTHGVSYNNLGFIYDLKSRKLVPGITVIPSDNNENGKIDSEENIYGDLDQLIQQLEGGSISNVTVDKVNIVFNKNTKPAVGEFIKWVQTSGQKFNHQYGFLTIDTDSKILAQQKNNTITSKAK